jgi:hypothetical protein
VSDETEWRRTEREILAGVLAGIISEHADEIDRAYVAFVRIVQDVIVAAKNWCDTVERERREELKRRALSLKPQWRKADVPRLLRLGIGGEPTDGRYMAMLLEGEGPRGGRGVVPEPKTIAEEVVEWIRLGQELFDPAAPPDRRCALYKETRWWPHLIEAAYRGELRKARVSLRGVRMNERYGATASEIAEESVADAVPNTISTISAATVHALCQRARDERGSEEPEYPEMTAAELKELIEKGRSPACALSS